MVIKLRMNPTIREKIGQKSLIEDYKLNSPIFFLCLPFPLQMKITGVCFSQCNAAWPENTLTVEWCWVEDEHENYLPCKVKFLYLFAYACVHMCYVIKCPGCIRVAVSANVLQPLGRFMSA